MGIEVYSLVGKRAIVTGAGNGICRAIAIAFADAGASVACVDNDGAAACQTVAAIEKAGGRAFAYPCDVSRQAAVRSTVKAAAKALGNVDVLVNGAAPLDPTGTVLDLDLKTWNHVFAVNVNGAYLMSRAVLPLMIRSGGGSIIHIASQLGSVATAARPAYCATKGALIQLARAMAIDHGPQNVRVNTLSPGAIETRRLTFRFGTMQKARKASGPLHALGRLGLPDEIAHAAVFLASDASSFMTGADLLVDGGYNAM